MKFEVVLSGDANSAAVDHLLRHYRKGDIQEDLCFALWNPSTGESRYTAIVHTIIPPEPGESVLHGNASFQPRYLTRAIKLARQSQSGLAFMHSHPSHGWQAMSSEDVRAERDVIAYPSGSTGLPLVGLTIGSDGYWSSRFWKRIGGKMKYHPCVKTRVVGSKSYHIWPDNQIDPPTRTPKGTEENL